MNILAFVDNPHSSFSIDPDSLNLHHHVLELVATGSHHRTSYPKILLEGVGKLELATLPGIETDLNILDLEGRNGSTGIETYQSSHYFYILYYLQRLYSRIQTQGVASLCIHHLHLRFFRTVHSYRLDTQVSLDRN